MLKLHGLGSRKALEPKERASNILRAPKLTRPLHIQRGLLDGDAGSVGAGGGAAAQGAHCTQSADAPRAARQREQLRLVLNANGADLSRHRRRVSGFWLGNMDERYYRNTRLHYT